MVLKELRLAVGRYRNVRVVFRRYEGGNLAIQMVDHKTGEPIAVASVNPPRARLPQDCVAVKDWSENEGMARELIRHKIIEPQPYAGEASGFVYIDFYKLHPDRVADLQAAGIIKTVDA